MNDLDDLLKKIAYVQGWTFYGIDSREKSQYWAKNPQGDIVAEETTPDACWLTVKMNYLPAWSTDMGAAYDLEEEIPLEQRARYAARFLRRIVIADEYTRPASSDPLSDSEKDWLIAHATPEQRCRAWLTMRQSLEQKWEAGNGRDKA